MTFPYLHLPPDVYEQLAEILGGGGFDAVSTPENRSLPPGLTGPGPAKDPTSRSFVISDADSSVNLSASFDTTFGHHVAYIIPSRDSGEGGKRLRTRVEQLLQSRGTTKK